MKCMVWWLTGCSHVWCASLSYRPLQQRPSPSSRNDVGFAFLLEAPTGTIADGVVTIQGRLHQDWPTRNLCSRRGTSRSVGCDCDSRCSYVHPQEGRLHGEGQMPVRARPQQGGGVPSLAAGALPARRRGVPVAA